MATQLQRKSANNETMIPDRLYFKIGDVAKICAVEPYVLRFWESQFPQLKPNKSGTGQRLYRRRDVEMVLEIKELVHAQGYTLNGARQALGQKPKSTSAQPVPAKAHGATGGKILASTVERARLELRAIAALLAEPVARPQKRRTRFAVASGELFPS